MLAARRHHKGAPAARPDRRVRGAQLIDRRRVSRLRQISTAATGLPPLLHPPSPSTVYAQAAELQGVAAETAAVHANIGWIQQHLDLVDRQSDQASHVDQPPGNKGDSRGGDRVSPLCCHHRGREHNRS